MTDRRDILLVEDDPALARATCRQLARRHDVRVVSSVDAALAEIARRPPQVLLCDYDLDSETATRLLEVVTRGHLKIRRILYSGSRAAEWQELIDRQLLDAVLQKPATLADLLSAIEGER